MSAVRRDPPQVLGDGLQSIAQLVDSANRDPRRGDGPEHPLYPIVFDDYLAYRGSLEKGVAGAFKDFQERNPEMQFRRAFDYGYGGQGFVRSR